MSTTVNAKKELGLRIRSLRKRQGLTQEEMADKCGLHWTYIGGLERGERNPTLTTMQKVAEGLGVGLTELLSAKAFQEGPVVDQDTNEGKLMRLLRRENGDTVALAAGILREVLSWRDKNTSHRN
jgi:transcriptional regulator with XRE-family HTH domain